MNDECEHSLINWLFRMIISWIPLYDLSDHLYNFCNEVHLFHPHPLHEPYEQNYFLFSIHFYFPHHLNLFFKCNLL